MSIYLNPKWCTGAEALARAVSTPGKCLDDLQKLADSVALLEEGIRSHFGRHRVAGILAAHRDLLDRGETPPDDRKQLDP